MPKPDRKTEIDHWQSVLLFAETEVKDKHEAEVMAKTARFHLARLEARGD